MTTLRWVRLDTGFPSNPKVLELAHQGRHRAIAVYLCGLAYAGSQGNEGWIPEYALPHIHGTKREARYLVDIGLWIARPRGWTIHDWLDYQPSNDVVRERTERAKAAALIRWNENGSDEGR